MLIRRPTFRRSYYSGRASRCRLGFANMKSNCLLTLYHAPTDYSNTMFTRFQQITTYHSECYVYRVSERFRVKLKTNHKRQNRTPFQQQSLRETIRFYNFNLREGNWKKEKKIYTSEKIIECISCRKIIGTFKIYKLVWAFYSGYWDEWIFNLIMAKRN